GGNRDEDRLLASCYRNSLSLARERGIRTIAFPAISTGVYGFPKERAARIAVNEARDFLAQNPYAFDKVIHVCFSQRDFQIFSEVLNEVNPHRTQNA
ncbi:MAG: macro domain-containing protein, partial [Chloroflexi bacterium]|nr:macro domain-containing protein [Chloroflexota bacterium]